MCNIHKSTARVYSSRLLSFLNSLPPYLDYFSSSSHFCPLCLSLHGWRRNLDVRSHQMLCHQQDHILGQKCGDYTQPARGFECPHPQSLSVSISFPPKKLNLVLVKNLEGVKVLFSPRVAPIFKIWIQPWIQAVSQALLSLPPLQLHRWKREAVLRGGRPFGDLFGKYSHKRGRKEQYPTDPTPESKQTV